MNPVWIEDTDMDADEYEAYQQARREMDRD